jgi:P-type conjugative transfer protein TrbG
MKKLSHALYLSAALLPAACAHEPPPPKIVYDNSAFQPALVTPPLAPAMPAPVISLPLPLDLTAAVPPEARPPTERVARANVAALQEPRSDAYLNATQVFTYADGALYHVYAAPQQVTDIILEIGETLNAISAGDTVRWAVGDTASGAGAARQIHIMVKPFTTGLKTNLVLLTNKRTYHLVLQSTGQAAMAAVSWTYPGEALVAARAAVEAMPVDTGVALDALRFRYEITGDTPPWRPLRAFDDGEKVYIEFPARIDQGEAPPLFVVGPNGTHDLVNYRVKGNYYIVDQLFPAAELRLGTDPQQVVRISRTDGQPRTASLEAGRKP